jgi:hypothetical protein
MISESARGEARKLELSRWYLKNKILKEYELDVSEEIFRAILVHTNYRLEGAYSQLNIVGIPFYDLACRLNSPYLMHLTTKIFADGIDSSICSEAVAFTLGFFGIQFSRPIDFVRPDHVIDALIKAAKTEDYIRAI